MAKRMSMFGGVNIQQGSYAGKTEQVIVENPYRYSSSRMNRKYSKRQSIGNRPRRSRL